MDMDVVFLFIGFTLVFDISFAISLEQVFPTILQSSVFMKDEQPVIFSTANCGLYTTAMNYDQSLPLLWKSDLSWTFVLVSSEYPLELLISHSSPSISADLGYFSVVSHILSLLSCTRWVPRVFISVAKRDERVGGIKEKGSLFERC